MIKKSEFCGYCEEKMDSITAKKKYCSNKCRLYAKRERDALPENRILANFLSVKIPKKLPNNSIKEESKTNNKYALLNNSETISNSELEARIANYKKELEIVPDVGFGKIRRKFLNSTIEKLSKQIRLMN